MEASSSASALPHQFELPAWKTVASHGAAAIVAFLFLAAGIFKAVDPYKFAALANNLLVESVQWFAPYTLALALGLAILETTAGVMVLVPRYRRWGAALIGAQLLFYMGYMGWNYTELAGRDCSCFPELKLPLGLTIDMTRSVGPGFFWGDGAMLAVAAVAGFWAKASSGLRGAGIILASVAVFAGVSFGVAYATVNGAEAPPSIVVDGEQMSLMSGRQFIFFYDPECTHCAAAAASMAPLSFKDDVTLIAVPVRVQQWAQDFLNDAKLTQAKTSLDVDILREKFIFEYPPYAVLIEDGKVAGTIPHFEDGGEEHILQMRELGVIN